MSEIRDKLKQVSTATVTTVLFKRGFRNAYMQGPRAVGAKARHMVGEAYTLRYIPAREDLDKMEVFRDPAHPQRRAIETCPPGHVLVMDSRGDPRAATAGGILVARLKQRGAAGIVTDGGFRDSAEIAELDIPAYHARPSAPANLLRHHAVEANVPIGCGGVAVYPGDWILGDGDGVAVIPAEIAAGVAKEALEQTIFEDFVMEQVQSGKSIVGLYPPTDERTLAAFAEWRKRAGR
ncbi:MAG: ribonuclease activity regulator RraA [Betaproteobacteria bacterium]